MAHERSFAQLKGGARAAGNKSKLNKHGAELDKTKSTVQGNPGGSYGYILIRQCRVSVPNMGRTILRVYLVFRHFSTYARIVHARVQAREKKRKGEGQEEPGKKKRR